MSNARNLADLIASGGVIEASEIADSTITGGKLASDITISTTGSITSGGLTVDTDTLYVDSSNNRVGIGTTSPSQRLHLSGNLQMGGTSQVIFNTNAWMAYSSVYSGLYMQANSGGNIVQQAVSGNIILRTGGAERVRLDNSGNLGLGTSSPSTNLHISGTGAPSILIQDSDGTNQTVTVENSSGVLRLYARNDTSDGQLIFYGNGGGTATEKFRIDDQGRVGIGTASPTQPLTVYSSSSAQIHLNTANPAIRFSSDTAGNSNTTRAFIGYATNNSAFMSGSTAGDLVISSNSTDSILLGTPSGKIIEVTGSGVDVTGDLTVSGDLTVNGTTTTINTTNTQVSDNLLELNSGATANTNDAGIIIERGSTGDNAIMAWDESADAFRFGTTTATASDTGNLTITESPVITGKLTVHTSDDTIFYSIPGSSYTNDQANAYFGFTSDGTSPGTTNYGYWSQFKITAGGGAGRSNLQIGMRRADGNADYPDLVVTHEGKVGIGESTPTELLHITSASSDARIVLESGVNTTSNGIKWVDESGNTQTEFYYGHANNRHDLLVNGNGFQIYSKQSSAVVAKFGINSSAYTDSYFAGNVGIGTSSPSTKLHVVGDITLDDGTNTAQLGTTCNSVYFGNGALASITTGTFNVAIGCGALSANTTGINNIAIGQLSLACNTTQVGNVAIGVQAARLNDNGYSIVAIGSYALQGVAGCLNHSNTAIGASSMAATETGSRNSSLGTFALRCNTVGNDNVAVGFYSLKENTTGSYNTAVGKNALLSNTTGVYNTAVGFEALSKNTTNTCNTAIGYGAGCRSEGTTNTFVGSTAGFGNGGQCSIGSGNTFIGRNAGYFWANANNNTLVGSGSGYILSNGGDNVGLGDGTLSAIRAGCKNVAIGRQAMAQTNGYSNNVAIGYRALYCNQADLNTAVGHEALRENTTGTANLALGYCALLYNTTGVVNTAIGSQVLKDNTTGNYNVGIGHDAIPRNTIGSSNIAVGHAALLVNTTGNGNVSIGVSSLRTNVTGNCNVAIGNNTMRSSDGVSNSVAIGAESQRNNISSTPQTSIGFCSLNANTTGDYNTALGTQTLQENTTGQRNVAVGYASMLCNTVGCNNISAGMSSLRFNISGNNNAAFGSCSLYCNTTGTQNTAVGMRSLFLNTTGSNNTAVGYDSGNTITTGSNLTTIGYNAEPSSATATNEITLGDSNVSLLRIPGLGATSGQVLCYNGSGFVAGAGTTNPTISSISPSAIPNTQTTVTITGTNFTSIPQVDVIDTSTGIWYTADSVTYTSSTTISANFTLSVDGDYKIRIENPDGNAVLSSTALLQVSDAPTWSTSAGSLGSVAQGDSASFSVSASSDSTVAYSVTSGSLPSGLSLNSSTGAITGTESGSDGSNTTYNFTITATDQESQTASRAFSITVSVGITEGAQFN